MTTIEIFIIGAVIGAIIGTVVMAAACNAGRKSAAPEPRPKTRLVGRKPFVYRAAEGVVISTRNELLRCAMLCNNCGLEPMPDGDTLCASCRALMDGVE